MDLQDVANRKSFGIRHFDPARTLCAAGDVHHLADRAVVFLQIGRMAPARNARPDEAARPAVFAEQNVEILFGLALTLVVFDEIFADLLERAAAIDLLERAGHVELRPPFAHAAA